MTKFFRDLAGSYLGAFDGAEPPAGAIEIAEPPPHALMTLKGGTWIETPASRAAKRPALDADRLFDALKARGHLVDQDVGR